MEIDALENVFYSENNIVYLEKVIEDIESGKAVIVEHELIETFLDAIET